MRKTGWRVSPASEGCRRGLVPVKQSWVTLASRKQSVIEQPIFPESKTVLLVDDEPVSRYVFVRALERHGYNVIEAANMDEALVVCREETVDLLIAELMLRDGFGTDLAKKVREHCPDVPVLLTCGTPLDGCPDAHRKRFDELGFGTD